MAKFIKRILLFLAVCGCVVFILSQYDVDSVGVVATSCVIIFLAMNGMLSGRIPYGLSLIFYLFTLVFLGIAPLIQYFEGITLWGGPRFTDNDYLETNLILIMALIIYRIVYSYIYKYGYTITLGHNRNNKNIKNYSVSSGILILISVVTTLYLFVIFKFDVLALLLRSVYNEADVASGNTFTFLLNCHFIRPIPAICFLMFKFYGKRDRIAEIVLLFLMLLTNSPTGMARFAVAAFYIPLVFLYSKSVRRPYNFAILMIFGIVVVFPLLDIFRYIGEGGRIGFGIDLMMFASGHFDSYQMFMRVVAEDFITDGRQLLGALLFFVPRSIWPSKPIGSGYVIAYEYNYGLDNLSMNFFGEGYINFGLIGVIIFTLIIAYINANMDRRMWLGERKSPLFTMVFFISMGMEFAIMRGALMNIMPILIGYIFASYIINCIAGYTSMNQSTIVKNNVS